jgi:hypothetical protein
MFQVVKDPARSLKDLASATGLDPDGQAEFQTQTVGVTLGALLYQHRKDSLLKALSEGDLGNALFIYLQPPKKLVAKTYKSLLQGSGKLKASSSTEGGYQVSFIVDHLKDLFDYVPNPSPVNYSSLLNIILGDKVEIVGAFDCVLAQSYTWGDSSDPYVCIFRKWDSKDLTYPCQATFSKLDFTGFPS